MTRYPLLNKLWLRSASRCLLTSITFCVRA
ncbi:unnamed protein product [Rhizoctonia solani]|uniref:Uncharacterized protein n=1 Tax=Rhizoctonia solani TaxID=456999 RepID=A0A8H3AU08_9AGAM|nr:unnamed protein product [Rhizoctonia solani]